MKTLETKFQHDGFTFRQLRREGDVCLYLKNKPDWSAELYEVFIVQKRAEHTWPNGNVTEAHESMPGKEQWGSQGWSFCTEDIQGAKKRFNELVETNANRPV